MDENATQAYDCVAYSYKYITYSPKDFMACPTRREAQRQALSRRTYNRPILMALVTIVNPAHPRVRSRFMQGLILSGLLALLAACAAGVGSRISADNAGMADLASRMPHYDFVLLGEVHDNPDGHALRREALAQALTAGWRPIIAMEQFDQENQALLDQAMSVCTDASCVVAKAAPQSKGWDWNAYKPVIALALQHHLRIVAANLSRPRALLVMRGGLDAVFDAQTLGKLSLASGPPQSLLLAQEKEVEQGHCGKLPVSLHEGMATAQIARDATMAVVMRDAAQSAKGSPVVLLAGNGHVRKDIGVPYWLAAAAGAEHAPDKQRVLAVGFNESAGSSALFDLSVRIPPAERPDPCAAFIAPKAAPAK